MKILLNTGITAACVCMVTASAFAQAKLGQTQEGTNGGQPGNTAAQPNTASGGNFNGINQSPWFGNNATRQQLQINEQQYNQLNNNYQKAYSRYNDGLNGLDRNLTPQAREQRQMQLHDQFRQDFSAGTNDVYTDPTARQRFNGMDYQYRGYSAFNDPTVQKQLNLTDAQRQKFNQYGQDWNQQHSNWQQEYPRNQQLVGKQFSASRVQMQDRIKSTLTPDQQQQWNQMSGQPYNFTPDMYFGNQSSVNNVGNQTGQ
jgi:hypothetical protein